jgi:hypothetical protein
MTTKLSVDEIIAIMNMYDLERADEHTLDNGGAYSKASYVWGCLKHLEYNPAYVYQFEDPPQYNDGPDALCDLYGQAVDRVAAFLKYGHPIIVGDE